MLLNAWGVIMALQDDLVAVVGPAHVLTGADAARYRKDWTGKFTANPVAVVRPASTAEVAACVKVAAAHGVGIVPVSGLTGIVGGAMTDGGLMISVERLNRIRDVQAGARVAVVEAGVVLSRLHEAAAEQGLYFPLWFGARGSAMIGGVLSTNAGGSNVLRYGSTRALCLGLEVVLADGRVLNLMSALHKDNSGYDLRDLFIGAEGTLGIITAAVMKLVPAPRAYATATLALPSVDVALGLLNRLRDASGGMVEAFEFMPDTYMRRLAEARPDVRQAFSPAPPVTILVELGAVAARDAGMEVVYGGIRSTIEQIVAAARDEDPDVIGLSILSGSHLSLVPALIAALRAEGVDAPVVVGGIIPEEDRPRLAAAGVAAVYTPKDFELATIMRDVANLTVAHRGEPSVSPT